MSLDPTPGFSPNQPIPNSPFYWPTTYTLQSGGGNLIVGNGLEVTGEGVIVSTGSGTPGTGTVTLVDTGIGLSGGPITTTGTIRLVAASAISIGGMKPDGVTTIVAADGTVTATTVTEVNTGTGLSGGPITSDGTITLLPATPTVIGGVKPDNSTLFVTPSGTIYADPNNFGIGSIVGISPINVTTTTSPKVSTISIDAASSTAPGVVQLATNYTGTSETLVPSQRVVNNLSIAALLRSGGTMTGNITFAPSQTFPIATLSKAGAVIPDGTTITLSPSGVISAPPSVSPGGPANAVQYKSGTTFGGSATFTFNPGTGILSLPAVVQGQTASPLTISPALNINGQTLNLNGGGSSGASQGGRVNVTGGTSISGQGGDVYVRGGGARDGGSVYIQGGTATSGTAGGVNITSIVVASAVSTYVPAASTDLTTKAYVDTAVAGARAAGENQQVQFNNNGSFGAVPQFFYDSGTQELNVPIVITSSVNPGVNNSADLEVAGSSTNQDGGTGGDLLLSGGDFTNIAVGFDGDGGNVVITGGGSVNPLSTNVVNGGNVSISGGLPSTNGLRGEVSIIDIALANTVSTYQPTQPTHLATKQYVDTENQNRDLSVATIATTPYTIAAAQLSGFFAVSLGSATQVFLPDLASVNVGALVYIKDVSGTRTAPITINVAAGSGNTIDGQSSIDLVAPYNSFSLIALPTGWGIF